MAIGDKLVNLQDLKVVKDEIDDDVGNLKSAFTAQTENVFGHGINYYNYKTALSGYVLKVDGSQIEENAGFISDYIAVEPNTTYNKRYVFNSSAIADVVFYTSAKAFISSFYHSGSTTYFTTPSNCAYIRICGYAQNIASEQVQEGTAFTSHQFYQEILYPSAGGADVAYLFADSQIVINQASKQITTACPATGSKIHLHIPGIASKQYDIPISYTGTGSILYYNSDTDSFTVTDADVVNEKIAYRIAMIGLPVNNHSVKGTFDNGFIVSNKPIMEYDFVESKIHVSIEAGTYFWQNKTFVAITVENYDLSITNSGINCVWFNLATKKFTVSNSFRDYSNNAEFVSIGYVWGSNVCLSIPCIVKDGNRHTNTKKAITYGDSLTWYDGHAFDLGEYQGETCFGYQTYLRNVLGMTVTNQGASGSSTPQFVQNKILTDGTSISETDYVIIMPSIMNDDRLNVSPGTPQPIGGTFDDTTTAGALQTAVEFIYSVNPGVRIVIIVEPMGFTYRDGAPHMTNELLPIAIRNVAKLYGIPCIDLWEKSGINALTRNTYFADPSFESGNEYYMYHPNNFGWQVLSRIICEEMKGY